MESDCLDNEHAEVEHLLQELNELLSLVALVEEDIGQGY